MSNQIWSFWYPAEDQVVFQLRTLLRDGALNKSVWDQVWDQFMSQTPQEVDFNGFQINMTGAVDIDTGIIPNETMKLWKR